MTIGPGESRWSAIVLLLAQSDLPPRTLSSSGSYTECYEGSGPLDQWITQACRSLVSRKLVRDLKSIEKTQVWTGVCAIRDLETLRLPKRIPRLCVRHLQVVFDRDLGLRACE